MSKGHLLLAMSQMKVDGNIAFLVVTFKLVFVRIPVLGWQLMDKANLIYFIWMSWTTFQLEKLAA